VKGRIERIVVFLAVGPWLGATPLFAQTGYPPGGATLDRSRGAKAETVGEILDPVVRGAVGRVGVAVYSVDRQEPLYLRNADVPLVPASNMKLYTTAAALDRLGLDFRYTTSVYGTGPVLQDGTLDGDLVLAGRGDPTLSGRFYGDSVPYVLDRLAEKLRQAGVRKVAGGLIGDASFFDDELLAPGWEEANLLWWYGARASGLSFNDNVAILEVRPGGWVGAGAHVGFEPRTERLTVVNRVRTVGRRGGRSVGIKRRPDLEGYEIWGRIPITSSPLRYVVAVDNPPLFTLSVLRDRLQRAGITVDGDARVVHDRGALRDRPWTLLASHTSPRLLEIVRVVNKRSQNHFAEQVLKTLGAVFLGEGSFEAGAEVVLEFLRDMGITTEGIRIDDGSGLSRRNVVTARQTAELLVSMASHPRFDEFYDSLLIAGSDGDPRRLDAPEVRDNVHSKTGTLRGVSALSGYVTTRDGELLAFSVITNGLRGGKGRSIVLEDAVAERLAAFSEWHPPLVGSVRDE